MEISRDRLDALGDGIFGVAMTLLVLDVRLPDDFTAQTSQELLNGIFALGPKFLPYLLSFYVLGERWMSEAQQRQAQSDEKYSRRYAQVWLLLLFLVTCTPLTTTVIGRFASIPPAIWLYVGNIVALAVVSYWLATLGHRESETLRARTIALGVVMFSGALAIGVSFFAPHQAILALLVSMFTPVFVRWGTRA